MWMQCLAAAGFSVADDRIPPHQGEWVVAPNPRAYVESTLEGAFTPAPTPTPHRRSPRGQRDGTCRGQDLRVGRAAHRSGVPGARDRQDATLADRQPECSGAPTARPQPHDRPRPARGRLAPTQAVERPRCVASRQPPARLPTPVRELRCVGGPPHCPAGRRARQARTVPTETQECVSAGQRERLPLLSCGESDLTTNKEGPVGRRYTTRRGPLVHVAQRRCSARGP